MATLGSPPSTSTRVTVRCSQPQLVAGLPLRVLASDGIRTNLVPIDAPSFDSSGEAGVDLAPGVYSFEVAALRNDTTIVVLHSEAISVPRVTSAKLIAGRPQSLAVSHEDSNVELTEVAVRSEASTDEVRWHRKASMVSPELVLTPGKSTRINVIGSTGPVYVAAWEKVTANARATPLQLRTQSRWTSCQFARRAGTPITRSVTAVLSFPDSRLEIPVTDNTRVLTNRRFVMMGYRVELDDGKCLEFEPLPYIVNRPQRFELGGAELTPRAWAAYIPEIHGGKQSSHLLWRYDLLDPGGHRLNIRAANCGAAGVATRVDGKPVPDGAIDEQERTAIGDPTRSMRVEVEWTWNGSRSREVPPESLVSVRSQHFQIEAVPAWTWRSQSYLSMLERLYSIERTTTSRPGPASVRVRWRNNPRSGTAAVGRRTGGQRLSCSLPFRAYEASDDPFGSRIGPSLIAHEMLHNFGYSHGPEMDRMVELVASEFARYRWYIIDHPEIVPMMAQVR